MFCNRVGFPIYVKGCRQGAAMCNNFQAVLQAVHKGWAKGGFLQKLHMGFNKGLTFSAYKGELLGAVIMEKDIITGDGKAWGGTLSPVPMDLLVGLATFCRTYSFTGGSELEYIEDITGRRYAIDWNPRFPAFIYATRLAGVNLVGALVSRCMLEISKDSKLDTQSLFNGCTFVECADLQVLSIDASSPFRFTRTVIEEVDVRGMSQRDGSGGNTIFPVSSGKSGMNVSKSASRSLPIVPHSFELKNYTGDLSATADKCFAKSGTDDACMELRRDLNCFLGVGEKSNVVTGDGDPLECLENVNTPCYVFSMASARSALATQRDIIFSTLQRFLLSSSKAINIGQLGLQMCVSVKTQPYKPLLEAARLSGYAAECITLAEVHAAIRAGFPVSDIILTGPGKFWDNKTSDMTVQQVNGPLRTVFADSLADLKRIISYVADGSHWLKASTVGLRLAPLGGVISRFGMYCNPKNIREAALLLKSLPSDINIGFHFHHAQSTVGSSNWWGWARSFVTVSAQISNMSGRAVHTLDFGGGWSPHFMELVESQGNLCELFEFALQFHPELKIVEFEPGKSISARSGALLTRVLQIREIGNRVELKNDTDTRSSSGSDLDVVADIEGSDIASCDTTDTDGEQEQQACPKGVILDGSFADLATAHVQLHLPMWRKRDSTTDNDSNASQTQWELLTGGVDVLYGRSCMEFDLLGSTPIRIPPGMTNGDYVMFAFSGAYDCTMQYDFADGESRKNILAILE
jgi:diaminopimelate decarboxylase